MSEVIGSPLKDFLGKQKLAIDEIRTVDLRNVYVMQTPDKSFDHLLFREGKLDRKLPNSPHAELAQFYYQHGEKWLRKHYRKTRYCYMREHYLGKSPVRICQRVVPVWKSIKEGYLRPGHAGDYIVALEIPFCNSRYKLGEANESPQLFLGHHRAAGLIALERYEVPVLFAIDKCGFVENDYAGSAATPRERQELNKK
jgi:hypothetical protein